MSLSFSSWERPRIHLLVMTTDWSLPLFTPYLAPVCSARVIYLIFLEHFGHFAVSKITLVGALLSKAGTQR